MDLKKAVIDRFDQYRKKPTANYGFVGILTTGVISVPGKSNMIYVTLVSGKIMQVLNNRVPNVFQQPVIVGRDDMLPYLDQVLSVWDVYGGRGSTTPALASSTVIPYDTMTWPGINTIYIMAEQFLTGLVFPKTGMTIEIYPGTYRIAGGWKQFTQKSDINMTSHLPSTAGYARYALIVVDSTGAYAVRDGADVSAGYAVMAVSDIPAPNTGDHCLYAVKLFHGQTVLKKEEKVNDFVDLRFSGADAGGGSSGETASSLGVVIAGTTAKVTPIDADNFGIVDSAASNILKKITWSSLKSALKAYFDTIYAGLVHYHSGGDLTSGTVDGDRLPNISATKRGGVPATGTPSGKFLKDDDTWSTPAGGGSSGGSSLTGILVDCTSQIGSTAHFTITTASSSIAVMVDGVTQSPSDVTLDSDGLGFTLAFTPATSDTNSLLALCMTPGSGGSGGGGGGSSLPTWITNHPDNPPSSPNSMDDEFSGTTLNSKWSQQGGGTYTWTVSGGSVRFQQAAAPSERLKGLEQVISGSAWKFRTRASLNSGGSNYMGVGLYVRDSVSGKVCWFGMIHHSAHGYFAPLVLLCSNMETYIGEVDTDAWYMSNRWYMELEYDGTNFIFRHSADGINYFTIFAYPQSAYLATTPNQVGIAVHRWNPLGMDASYDWFRRIS